MSTPSSWGDPRERQIKAVFSGYYTKEVEVLEKRILGVLMRKAEKKKISVYGDLSTDKGDVVPDDVQAHRTFEHRCGLIKVINVFSGDDSTATIYLDGFPNIVITMGSTKFVFDPELENGPVADVSYRGFCTRRGDMQYGRHDAFVSLVFKDRDQMKNFVVATSASPSPKQAAALQSSGCQASDGDSSMWPLAAGVALGLVLGS